MNKHYLPFSTVIVVWLGSYLAPIRRQKFETSAVKPRYSQIVLF